MMYFKVLFIGLFALLNESRSSDYDCVNRSWYVKFTYPFFNAEYYSRSVNSSDTISFYVTSGYHSNKPAINQHGVDYFELKITPDLNQTDSMFFLFHTPGIHILTGEYIARKANHKVLVPLGSVFKYYDHFPDCDYASGAITGFPTVVELEPGTGNRKFAIELINVSGGHTAKAGKPPIYLTVKE